MGQAIDQNNVTVRGGWFAFFVATEAPLLVGKVLAERVGDDGDPGSICTGRGQVEVTFATAPRV